MKKLILCLTVLLFAAVSIYAQSFTLSMDGEVLGDTVTVVPDVIPASEIVFQAVVNNNTVNGTNIKVLRNEVFMLEGTSSYFKWGPNYFNDTTNLSPNYQFVPAGGSSTPGNFSGNYRIQDAVGISIIEYTFFNLDNPDENVQIVVKYDSSPTAIDENILKNIRISEIYPNPAINNVNIDYEMPIEVNTANVKIFNLMGVVVKEQQIETRSNQLTMNIMDLNKGIYFYTLFINGEAFITKKLVVR